MDGAWLGRMRWRRRGAWLWPAFAAATALDAVVGTLLPPSGETQNLVSAALVGLVLNLLGIVLLTRPLGALLRRVHRALPTVVARDYAGTSVVLAVAAVLLTAGLVHRPMLVAHRQAMRDAIVRAQAWIGDRAPAEFRRNVTSLSALVIQAGSLYRMCVPTADHSRTYCVIVNTRLPFGRSVSFTGYEPNSVFSQGVG